MEGTFFYGDFIRWNLGWINPNLAGCFLIGFFPWIWAIGGILQNSQVRSIRRDLAQFLVLGAELCLWFLLFKTYSRGAIVALAAVGVTWMVWRFVFVLRPQDKQVRPWKSWWPLALLRTLGITMLLFLTGFAARVDPTFVASDASALNRLELWSGGVRLLALSPWSGWGADQSGAQFMHWYQPYDMTAGYGGMVNSYLHLGVERGLRVLCTAFAGLITLVLLPVFLVPNRMVPKQLLSAPLKAGSWQGLWVSAAAASLATLLLANIFSTLWVYWNLWWLPLGNACVLLWIALSSSARFKNLGAAAAGGIVASTLLAVFLMALGNTLESPIQLRVENHAGFRTVVARPASVAKDAPTYLMLSDSTVLGDRYGKEIRRLILHEDCAPLQVATPITPRRSSQADKFHLNPEAFSHYAGIIAVGAQVKELEKSLASPDSPPDSLPRLILLHPSSRADLESLWKPSLVLLPMVDTNNNAFSWRKFGATHGTSIVINPGVAQDVRAIWPECLLPHLNSTDESDS